MNSRPGSDCLNIGQYAQKGSDCSLPSSSFTIYLPSKANRRTNSQPQPQISGGTAVWIFSHRLSHLSFMRFLHLYSLTSSIRSTMQQARSPKKHKTIIIIKAAIIFCSLSFNIPLYPLAVLSFVQYSYYSSSFSILTKQ